jgi:hypothetical protein
MIEQWTTTYDVDVPRMTHPSELGLCRYLADEIGRDDPVIFDLGPWLGATTIAFRHGNPLATIHAVDNFLWVPGYMNVPYKRHHDALPYNEHDSFVMEYLENIHWTVDCGIFVHAKNIETYLPPQEKADILFCDILKRPGGCRNVILNWLPRLKVGGYFLDQDFRWNPLTYVHWHVAMWRLREFLTPLIFTQHGCTVCWEKRRDIPDAVLDYAARFQVKDWGQMRNQSQEILSAEFYFKDLVGL